MLQNVDCKDFLAVYAHISLKGNLPNTEYIYFTYIEFIFFTKKRVKNAKLSSVKRGGLF